ncbi:MAG TPA: FtsW/RodA/SpoVE family cell cycle protein [Thermomicrobiales bacterium]|jgi:cell division protein FtsW (lipid II flippase)|nr:FtsW/RodA/SpoVE family cell cycle protein [Thermomicrobiales bacterium]
MAQPVPVTPGGSRRHYRPTLRLTEFQLLIAPALLTIVGLLTIYLAPRNDLLWSWGDVWVSLVYAGLIAGASIVFALARLRADQIVLPIVATLAGLGLLIIQRLQPDIAAIESGLAGIASRQVAYLTIGLVLMVVVALFRPAMPLLRRYKYTALVASLGLLAVTFVFGQEINGARLWLSFGPVQIQPSEIVKVTLLVFLAGYLDEKRDLLRDNWKVGGLSLPPLPWLMPMGLMWAASIATVVVLNDLGSGLLFFGIFLVMIYAATGRGLYVGLGLASFAIACVVLFQLFGRIAIRVQNWLNPFVDPYDSGYQQIQSDYAISSGGIFGTGLGLGQPYFVSQVHTDYVFAAFGEELGLLGTMAIITLYLLLVLRAFIIGLRADDTFDRLVAVGIGSIVAIQTLIILGGVLRVIPLTGITLPFISYGGSSLLTNFILVGLLLNISARRSRG